MAQVAKRHPRDGQKRNDYVASKIAHMRRIGVIVRKDGGYGCCGGAAPDWLVDEQKEEAKRLFAAWLRMRPTAA